MNERFYAECQTCCSAMSGGDELGVEDWADAHEEGHEGHRVTIGELARWSS